MTRSGFRSRYDVVIAGARVAGAATGLLLARAGLSVLIVDPARRGSDTLSTHALMRGGVLQLHRWGVLGAMLDADTPLIETTTFYYGDEPISVRIKPRDGIEGLIAPRRTVIDTALIGAAEDAGAHVAFGSAVVGLLRDPDGRVRGAEIRTPDRSTVEVDADLVIGADGMRSHVAKLVGSATTYQVPFMTASIYAHVRGLGLDGYRWYYGEKLAMGTIPTNDDRTCVFASMPPTRFETERGRGLDVLFTEVLQALSPEVAARVEAAPQDYKHRGFAGAPSVLKRATGPGWALVGDAGYFKDPLTAHGMTDALRDAELLARAVVGRGEAAISEYESTRDRLSRPLMDVTSRIAAFDWTLEEAKEHHLTLAREMSKEVDLIREWDAEPVAA